MLFREGIRVFPSTGTWGTVVHSLNPSILQSRIGKETGKSTGLHFLWCSIDEAFLFHHFRPDDKSLLLPWSISMRFRWGSDLPARCHASQRPADSHTWDWQLKSVKKCLCVYFQVCTHTAFVLCPCVKKCVLCMSLHVRMCSVCVFVGLHLCMCLCGACVYIREDMWAELKFMFRLCLWVYLKSWSNNIPWLTFTNFFLNVLNLWSRQLPSFPLPPAKQEAVWSSCHAGMHSALLEHALLLLFLKLLEGLVREVLGVHCRLFLITES